MLTLAYLTELRKTSTTSKIFVEAESLLSVSVIAALQQHATTTYTYTFISCVRRWTTTRAVP